MKRLLLLISIIFLLLQNISFAATEIYSEENKFGLKDSSGEIITKAQYNKLIRLGDNAFIAQKKSKFGIIDTKGEILVPLKYRHTERVLGKYAKLGNYGDFGLYDSTGFAVIPPVYDSIDLLFGGMLLTYKNYKYGIVDSNGNEVLENEYEDIYMPTPDTLRIKYQGEWYEVERAAQGDIELPENTQKINVDGNELKITKIITDTGIISGYSALTAADYLLKLITSISPAYEETIDELMFSQGAETVNIFFKLGWIPKFPFTYAKKYYENLRHPSNGPLSDIREDVIKQLKN